MLSVSISNVCECIISTCLCCVLSVSVVALALRRAGGLAEDARLKSVFCSVAPEVLWRSQGGRAEADTEGRGQGCCYCHGLAVLQGWHCIARAVFVEQLFRFQRPPLGGCHPSLAGGSTHSCFYDQLRPHPTLILPDTIAYSCLHPLLISCLFAHSLSSCTCNVFSTHGG